MRSIFFSVAKGVVVLLSLVAVACNSSQSGAKSQRRVKCEGAVAASDSFESASFSGRVVAATDVNLGFRVAGIVEQICVEDGAYIREGDVLARLDRRDYALQLAATEAEYAAVKAEVDRVVALFAEESVSANDYDKATNGLRAITAKLEAHQNALADTELRAPFNGYMQRRNFDKGEAVAAGRPVVAMISDRAPEITIDIPAAYYLKQGAFEGAVARVGLLRDKTFALKLKSISPKANLNQLYRATFTVQPDSGVVPTVGMSAMVEMRYRKKSDESGSVEIPFSAIVERAGESRVWVFEDGTVESRKIVLREIRSGGRAVVAGLAAGDMVVAAGVNSLKEGESVQLLEQPAASNVGGIK